MASATQDPRLLQPVAATTGNLASLMAEGDLPERVVAVPTPTARVEERPATRIRTLSVVIPAKNEALNLPGLLREVDEALRQMPQLVASEVLVIDDGSRDDTPAIARAHGARLVAHAESLGNGAAVKRGLREARHDWILLLDGDGQHPPGELPAMAALAERFDMVVASRGGRGGSLHRNFANQVYNRLASYVSGRRIPDLTSGYRLLRADIAKDLVCLLPNTFSYPTTMTMAMLRAGFGVAFHPFQVRQRQGKSHIRLVADGSRFFLIILRIATFFAPLRVFLPVSAAVAAVGVGWYLYTWLTEGRFTNMAVLLLGQATLLFALGLISEQIASLRFMRLGRGDDR